MDNLWKVTVVTISYNSKAQLEQTLNTLKTQDYPRIESVIVDGGSTDGSLEVIQKFAEEFKGSVKWISEPDKGIYNAVNKGIRMATGDIIGFYWDLYHDDTVLSKMVDIIQKEKTDGVHSDLVYEKENGEVVRYWKMGKGEIRKGWMPGHPTLYLKKEVYERYGLYDENYKCSGDYEFMVRILKNNEVKLSYIPEILLHMFYGGLSTSGWKAYWQSIKEGYLALKQNQIKFPAYVTLLRIIKTSKQFRKKK